MTQVFLIRQVIFKYIPNIKHQIFTLSKLLEYSWQLQNLFVVLMSYCPVLNLHLSGRDCNEFQSPRIGKKLLSWSKSGLSPSQLLGRRGAGLQRRCPRQKARAQVDIEEQSHGRSKLMSKHPWCQEKQGKTKKEKEFFFSQGTNSSFGSFQKLTSASD